MKQKLLMLAGLLLVLVAVNLSVFRYERILSQGQVVLLELVPVDPRSLMQGDYMSLRFGIAQEIEAYAACSRHAPGKGYAVLQPDERGVARFVRLETDVPVLAQGLAVQYRLRHGRAIVGTDAFFFEETRAEHFAAARYGELRVGPDGTVLLTALRDAHLGTL